MLLHLKAEGQLVVYAELDLFLRMPNAGVFTADLRFRGPESLAETDLVLGVPLSLDLHALDAQTFDTDAYGRALTAQLFATALMREAWATVRGFLQAANTPLRLRLRIEPRAELLHRLRWETLRDPVSGVVLCRSERILFARYLDTASLEPLVAPPLSALRALIAVANPSDLAQYDLAPVDVTGEVNRTRTALGDLPSTLLASGAFAQRPTLNRMIDALRTGHTILYLVCHGTLVDDQPVLYLEREDGTSVKVFGEDFVQRIADLPTDRRPLLVVLATCQSAGHADSDNVLAALGPRLARAGIGAVIGMQGNVPMATVEQLMPRLFTLLHEDGQIDRALALARADLAIDTPWWMPVLYMRVRDGRIWQEPEPAASQTASPVPLVAEGLDALLGLLRSSAVRTTVAAFRNDFSTARAQVADVIALKDVHDLLHTLQFQCYNPLTREVRSFPDDDLAIEAITDYALTLRMRTAEIHAVFDRAPLVLGASTWVADLEVAQATLQQALVERAIATLRKALWQINRVLAVQPSYINANLIAQARALRLRSLVDAMGELRSKLTAVTQDQARLLRFETGVTALVELRYKLERLIADHDAWQAIDREVRRLTDSLRYDTTDLELSWPDLQARLATLLTDETMWAQAFHIEAQQLDNALASAAVEQVRSFFQRCNRIIGERFFQVDVDLKRLCSQLRELGDPLTELERILT